MTRRILAAALAAIVVALPLVETEPAAARLVRHREVWTGFYTDPIGRTGVVRAVITHASGEYGAGNIYGPLRCTGEGCAARRGTLRLRPCFSGPPMCASITFREHRRRSLDTMHDCGATAAAPLLFTRLIVHCGGYPNGEAALDLTQVR